MIKLALSRWNSPDLNIWACSAIAVCPPGQEFGLCISVILESGFFRPSSSKSFLYLSHLKKVMLCLFYPWSRGPTWRSLVWFVRLRFRNLGVQSGCLPACLSLFTQSIGSVCKFSSAFFIPVMLTSKDMGHIILRAHYWKKRFYSMSIRPGIWRGRWINPSLAHHQTHRVNPLR
jgi:hypothetical protein